MKYSILYKNIQFFFNQFEIIFIKLATNKVLLTSHNIGTLNNYNTFHEIKKIFILYPY